MGRNRCSWTHCLRELARVAGIAPAQWLDESEILALDGKVSPQGIIVPKHLS